MFNWAFLGKWLEGEALWKVVIDSKYGGNWFFFLLGCGGGALGEGWGDGALWTLEVQGVYGAGL